MISLYRFRFLDAEKISGELSGDFPDSPWGALLDANIQWWKIITGENTRWVRDRFYKDLKVSDSRLSGLDENEKLYCRLISSSLRSRLELMNGRYLSALVILNSSKKYFKQMEGKEFENEAFYLTQGLFQYFVSVARARTGYFSYFLPYKADKKKGLEYLRRLTSSPDQVLRTESNYFLMKIYLETEKDALKAKPYADYLLAWYPENQVFCFYNQKVNALVYGKSFRQQEHPCLKPSGGNNTQLSENQRIYLNFLQAQNN